MIDTFVFDHPHIINQLLEDGAAGRALFKKTGEEEILALKIAKLLGAKDTKRGPRSKWRAGIVEAYVNMAGDPDTQIAGWLRDGAPTGVAKEIEACGVFPKVESTAEANTELHKFYARVGGRPNYKSAEENAGLVKKELERLHAEGYIKDYGTWDQVRALFGDVIISRLAAIIKTKEDGTIKVRLIVDMLRSHVNAFVKLHERVVLPRLMDVVTNLVDLALASPNGLTEEEFVEMMGLDFADAFHSMGVAKEELPYQVFRKPGEEGYAGYDTVVFGGGGAGLVWGRGGALLGRSGQALFSETEARIEIYVDDPWTGWRGTRRRIKELKVRLLLWWIVLGPEISWSKVQQGDLIKWIGANIHVHGRTSVALSLPPDYALELQRESEQLLEMSAVIVSRIQTLAGKSSWVAGFIPAVGSMIAPFWAAIADCKGKHTRMPQGVLVPIARIRHALLWLVAFCKGQKGVLKRVFQVAKHKAWGTLSMEFDASPWGYGGVLFWCGQPWSYFAEPITTEDVARFGLVIGSCTHQALLETIAILIGVRAWLPYWTDERLAVRIRSDSSAALGAVGREKSSNPQVNSVVREIALDLAEGVYKIDIKEHLPGKDNTWGDQLSRLFQPGVSTGVPEGLAFVGMQAIPKRDDAWWRTGAV